MPSLPTPPRSLRVAPLLAVAALASASGCGALDEFEQTIVDETTIPQTQPAQAPFAATFTGGGFSNVDLSNLQEFKNEGVGPGDVDAIYVKSITLDLATGSNNPAFDQLDNFLVSVELFVQSPGLERQTIAVKTMMPETATTQLDITPGDMLPGVNLKPYATAESMSFGAQFMLRDNRGLSAKLTTTIVLVVDINLFGA